jgi:hypothetical protein
MARAVSWNWEIEVDSKTIYPLEIGPFGEGEEGRLEVADGDRKYKIRDQIFNIDEIMIVILIKTDRYYYDILQDWSISGATKNVFLIARDSAKVPQMTFLCSDTDLAMGKHNGFNRQNKEPDKKTYYMIPEYVEEVF